MLLYSSVHYRHVLQYTKKTQPCLTGWVTAKAKYSGNRITWFFEWLDFYDFPTFVAQFDRSYGGFVLVLSIESRAYSLAELRRIWYMQDKESGQKGPGNRKKKVEEHFYIYLYEFV